MFPGQGSQEPGMGRDVYEQSAAARRLFDRADAVLGFALSRLCFEGPPDELSRTVNAQPALFATSLALLAAAKESGGLGHEPAFVAGHSLGEYTALAAAGALEFEAGLRLVRTRGEVTQAAADTAPGGMAAVLGLDEETMAAVCADAGVGLCNINSPGQIVIGGRHQALERACALALERGARRAIPLEVTGAFHTSLMEPAAAAMREAVAAAGLRAPQVPVVLNREASAVSDPDTIADELVTQLTHPVRWQQCVEYMAAQGATEFVEIGPGRVLTGLVKRIVPGARLHNVSGVSSLVG